MEEKSPKSPTDEKLVVEKGEISPRRSGNKWQRMFNLYKFPSMPASPSSPNSPDGFFHSPSYESILKQNGQLHLKKKEQKDKKSDKSENTLECR
ncbi:hypothetical protein QE152_g27591 [Popillia japonica]|uniref:Uncharacterized protein n=1 Tax=Popillia japonica TaxID=7064 RepID=A0AAW1JRQ6_POPJA